MTATNNSSRSNSSRREGSREGWRGKRRGCLGGWMIVFERRRIGSTRRV
jgi:hypothetical protein